MFNRVFFILMINEMIRMVKIIQKWHLVKLDQERILLLGWGVHPGAVDARQLVNILIIMLEIIIN